SLSVQLVQLTGNEAPVLELTLSVNPLEPENVPSGTLPTSSMSTNSAGESTSASNTSKFGRSDETSSDMIDSGSVSGFVGVTSSVIMRQVSPAGTTISRSPCTFGVESADRVCSRASSSVCASGIKSVMQNISPLQWMVMQ